MLKMFNFQEISEKYTAVSLQEAQEQVIVEQSVKICEDNNTVNAKHPFLKDPVGRVSDY